MSEPAPTDLDALCADYGVWLRTQCGSAPGTIKTYQGKLRSFLTFRFGSAAPGDLNAITRADIDAWFSTTDRKGLVGARSRACSLRSLFRFLFATGRIDCNLVLSVPRIAGPRSPGPIRHLSAEQVERVVAAARGETAIARRDHAMLLTMARLGLRGEEIIAIRLDDINWRAGEVLIRGKGARRASMPVPVDVGEAMVDWIRHGRRGPRGISLSAFDRPSSPSRRRSRSGRCCAGPMLRLALHRPAAKCAAMSSGTPWP